MFKSVHAYATVIDGEIPIDGCNQYYVQNRIQDNDDEPCTIIPGHIDYKRVAEIKEFCIAVGAYDEYIKELIAMLTGDKQ